MYRLPSLRCHFSQALEPGVKTVYCFACAWKPMAASFLSWTKVSSQSQSPIIRMPRHACLSTTASVCQGKAIVPPQVAAARFIAKPSRRSAIDAASTSALEALANLPLATVSPTVQQQPEQPRSQGVLQSVPVVPPYTETMAAALKRTLRVQYNCKLKNESHRERNKAARQMEVMRQELTAPITRDLDKFPQVEALHPFEQTLLQLTVGIPLYKSAIAKLHNLRKAINQLGKSYAEKAANASNRLEAMAVAEEGLAALQKTYLAGARHLDLVREMSRKLRRLPQVDYTAPTLALVGAPNVGKSSLVKVLSSGTPEVCNYPFTTRSLKMGHFFLDGKRHQVTDTPGLLNRPDEYRNAMEHLTLAALSCLPTSIVYVMDLTEECGTSLQDQWDIRTEVRQRFPDKPWIDVFSKADMLSGVSEGKPESVRAHSMHVVDASDFASRLPAASYISSVTQQGIPELQSAIIALLQKQQE